MCVALAVVAYLSVLAAPASAGFDWTGTAGPCGGNITTPPAGDPLADAAASQWYACWTATEHLERQLEAFGYRDPVETDPETGEPIAWADYSPGDIAWSQLGYLSDVVASVQAQQELLEQLQDAVQGEHGVNERLGDVNGTLAELQSLLRFERMCDDETWNPGPDRCQDPEIDRESVMAGEMLEDVRHLLVEIRDQPAATVEIDPEDLEPIVLASEETRDSFVETVWGSNGLWIGLAFLAVFWRIVRPGRT
jgi:hypothetical protein